MNFTPIKFYLVVLCSPEVIPGSKFLIAVQNGKEIESRDNLDAFADKFDKYLYIEIFVEQGLVFVPIFIVQVVWFIVPAAKANDVKSIYRHFKYSR